MDRTVNFFYKLEQDEDGAWCARATVGPDATAYGEGDTPEEAMADLREGVIGLLEAIGVPDEMAVTLNVA